MADNEDRIAALLSGMEHMAELKMQLSAYQIAKDNLELRLAKQFFGIDIPEYIASPPPEQVY